jgi:hypothetical protein
MMYTIHNRLFQASTKVRGAKSLASLPYSCSIEFFFVFFSVLTYIQLLFCTGTVKSTHTLTERCFPQTAQTALVDSHGADRY